jgi:hypothetical protein
MAQTPLRFFADGDVDGVEVDAFNIFRFRSKRYYFDVL